MFRAAIILQLILGLLVGPNGCCCAGQHLAVWLNPSMDAPAPSCCSAKSALEHAKGTCCSRTLAITDTRYSADSRTCPHQSCCDGKDQCECIAAVRPGLHRNTLEPDQYEITVTRALLGDGLLVEFASSIAHSLVSHCDRLRGLSQPGRACAIAFQRWNC
jgi:hypothetical protein